MSDDREELRREVAAAIAMIPEAPIGSDTVLVGRQIKRQADAAIAVVMRRMSEVAHQSKLNAEDAEALGEQGSIGWDAGTSHVCDAILTYAAEQREG